MKSLVKILISTLVIIAACDSEVDYVDLTSDMEKLITKNNWVFYRIEVNGQISPRVSIEFEPATRGGWIPWFWFSYNQDLSYEFRASNRSSRNYSYGAGDSFQPAFGFWELIEEQNLLIHNKGMPYEKPYTIVQLNDTVFIREYERIINSSPDTVKWPIGEVAVYREFLKKRE
jgi:hypothetical protein